MIAFLRSTEVLFATVLLLAACIDQGGKVETKTVKAHHHHDADHEHDESQSSNATGQLGTQDCEDDHDHGLVAQVRSDEMDEHDADAADHDHEEKTPSAASSSKPKQDCKKKPITAEEPATESAEHDHND